MNPSMVVRNSTVRYKISFTRHIYLLLPVTLWLFVALAFCRNSVFAQTSYETFNYHSPLGNDISLFQADDLFIGTMDGKGKTFLVVFTCKAAESPRITG